MLDSESMENYFPRNGNPTRQQSVAREHQHFDYNAAAYYDQEVGGGMYGGGDTRGEVITVSAAYADEDDDADLPVIEINLA
jgi:hypothetical protein